MRKKLPRLALALWIAILGMAGCAPSGSDPRASAQLEATQIILQARATALVEKAQAEATTIVLQAQNSAAETPSPAPMVETVQVTPPPAPVLSPTAAPTFEPGKVELLGVGMAAEGILIIVQFRASPKIAQLWQQGNVSVTNEATSAVYSEIPVYPSIGPLFARPKLEGQLGYFMLVNPEPRLQPGDIVTVQMGDFKFEHVKVQ